MEKSKNKLFHLSQEVDKSIQLIKTGLREFQNINASNVNYFIPFLLLANGYERLMKCMLAYRFYAVNDKFPTIKDFKKWGHDLTVLLSEILKECFVEETYNSREATRNDYEFLLTDEKIRTILSYFSSFGDDDRYYNLNIVGGMKNSIDTESKWQEMEVKDIIRGGHIELLENDPKNIELVYGDLKLEYIILFERLTRALVRQFTLGDLGEEAKINISYISPFLFIKDDNLGKNQY